MGKKKDRKNIDGIEKVDISFFLRKFCGIYHSDTSKMTHDAVKAFFPEIKRTSFAHILKNPELLRTGKVVLVRDAQFQPIPYMVPTEPIINMDESLTKDEFLDVILDSFKLISEFKENALLIFEGNNLLDKYLVRPRLVADSEKGEVLTRSLLEQGRTGKGLILGKTGNVYSYEGLTSLGKETGVNNLEEQAVNITTNVDAYALLIEGNDEIRFINDGVIYEGLDKESIHTMVKTYFLYEVEMQDEVSKDIKNYTLGTMSVYELTALMKYYKLSGQNAYYHVVRRELVKRTTPSKEYREAREKQKYKVKEEN